MNPIDNKEGRHVYIVSNKHIIWYDIYRNIKVGIKGAVYMEWKNIYRGMMMGASDLVPGVSGGTIAVLLGIYDQLIASINGIFTKQWRKHFAFLMPLAVGVGLAIFLLTHVMKWLLEYHERPTFFFFIGLIIGILPFLFRESEAKTHFKLQHYFLLVLAMILISLLPTNPSEGALIAERSIAIYGLLFLAGVIASAAMILPGISGSLVLLILGVYPTVLQAISELDIKVILTVGIGIATGIIVMSKIIHYFFTHYRTATFAMIIGLVIGSVYVIFPGWAANIGELIACIVVFAAGLFTAHVLGRVEY